MNKLRKKSLQERIYLLFRGNDPVNIRLGVNAGLTKFEIAQKCFGEGFTKTELYRVTMAIYFLRKADPETGKLFLPLLCQKTHKGYVYYLSSIKEEAMAYDTKRSAFLHACEYSKNVLTQANLDMIENRERGLPSPGEIRQKYDW